MTSHTLQQRFSTLQPVAVWYESSYAHAPMTLIPNAPRKTRMHAYTLRLPRRIRQLSSLRKSSESNSTREANTRRPDEMAFMIPTKRRPTSEPGSYKVCRISPNAWPIGVLEHELASKNHSSTGKLLCDLRATISKGHQPWLDRICLPLNLSDPRSKSESLERF